MGSEVLMRYSKTYSRFVVASLLVAGVCYAAGDGATPTEEAEAIAAPEARGVEMSETSSVVQRGVKRGPQISLEKALDLIAKPRPGGGGGGSKSAAGIGGGGGRPAGGGGGDGKARNRMKGNVREMMDTGS